MKLSMVDTIPKTMEPDTLYVSLKYNTASHLCPCGCGEAAPIPINIADGWKFSKASETDFSLHPSISKPWGCKSHYWIQHGQVRMC